MNLQNHSMKNDNSNLNRSPSIIEIINAFKALNFKSTNAMDMITHQHQAFFNFNEISTIFQVGNRRKCDIFKMLN